MGEWLKWKPAKASSGYDPSIYTYAFEVFVDGDPVPVVGRRRGPIDQLRSPETPRARPAMGVAPRISTEVS